MSSMVFSSAQFFLQSVTVVAPAVLRVRFSHDPKQVNPLAANDGLNPVNYALTGPHMVNVVAANSVVSDPQSIDIYLNTPLKKGLWTVSVSSAVEMGDNTTLTAPTSFSFDAVGIEPRELPNQGATSDQAYEVIRKHLPPSLTGTNWEALLRALSVGDQQNWDNAAAAFDQKFLASASGVYLDRKAADQGLARPQGIGMPDDLFRSYALKISAQKVTEQPLLDVLEVFYGADAVRAFAITEKQEPFVLSDGMSLKVLADNSESLEIVFRENDFGRIGYCTAAEVAVAITRQARAAGLTFFAIPENKKVKIYSGARGLASSVVVTGGLAQDRLTFPSESSVLIGSGVSFNITLTNQGLGALRARYEIQDADGGHFLALQPGHYVNISCPAFQSSNRGSFKVVDAGTIYNGANFFHFFEIENDFAVQQLGVSTSSARDVLFYVPTVARTYKGPGRSVSVAQTDTGVSVVLPATTQAVGRQEKTAAYLHGNEQVPVSQVQRLLDGRIKVTTTLAHGLSVGHGAEIDGTMPTSAAPAVLAGVPGSSGSTGVSPACHATAALQVRAPDSVVGGRFLSEQCLLATGDVLVVGGSNSVAPQADCTRFRLGSSTVLASGVAEGRRTYSYEWISTASAPAPTVRHTLTPLTGDLSPKALLLGGTTDGSAALSTASLYDPTLNTWTAVPTGTLTARYNHTAVRLLNAASEEIVVIVGGQSSPSAAVAMTQIFSQEAGGSLTDFVAESTGRFRHQAIDVTAHKMLVIGGAKFAPSLQPRDDCWAYDFSTSLYSSVGAMAVARMDFGVVQIPGVSVLVVGGFGRSLNSQSTDSVLNSCEILDLDTGRWRPTGALRYPRRNPQVVSLNGKIYAIGGLAADGSVVSQTEVYDLRTGTWSVAPSTAATSSYGDVVALSNMCLLIGNYSAGSVTAEARLFVSGANRLGTRLNGSYKVDSVQDSTTVYLSSYADGYSSSTVGGLTSLTAQTGNHAGPYVWDIDNGVAVTAVEATLVTPLVAGQRYRTLEVGAGQAGAFPEEDGWVVVGFGTSRQVTIPYIGKTSGSSLSIDYSFIVPYDIPSGAKVALVAQKGPYEAADAGAVGSFYATASAAGRVAAQSAVQSIVAAGLPLDIDVSYPGDKGLARAGFPKEGAVVSEKVHVWGGDDLDQELAVARQEG